MRQIEFEPSSVTSMRHPPADGLNDKPTYKIDIDCAMVSAFGISAQAPDPSWLCDRSITVVTQSTGPEIGRISMSV
jgi:hypothetical protein